MDWSQPEPVSEVGMHAIASDGIAIMRFGEFLTTLLVLNAPVYVAQALRRLLGPKRAIKSAE